jgi:hypothetical protein
MEAAFAAECDPALDLARHAKKSAKHAVEDSALYMDGAELWTHHLRRKEQDIIDQIIQGAETGHYYVLLGAKVDQIRSLGGNCIDLSDVPFGDTQGAGKTTMVIDAMTAIQAEGVAMCDAHPDLEVFRLRLGKALNYEFNEDSQSGLFQRRDPREGETCLFSTPSLPLFFVFANTVYFFFHSWTCFRHRKR